MVLFGTYRNGVVVPENPTKIREGQRVQIILEEDAPAESTSTVTQDLLKLAGIIKSGHHDASRNHDHYLYGAPKREPES